MANPTDCGRVGRLPDQPVRPASAPGAFDLSPLQAVGAANAHPWAARRTGVRHWPGGWRGAIGYGLTETAALLTLNPSGATKLNSVGRPPFGVVLRIAPSARPGGERRQPGASHTVGEILARGPGVCAGYHNLPDQTAHTFTNDGWFHTGDLGYVDDEGDFYVSGRSGTGRRAATPTGV